MKRVLQLTLVITMLIVFSGCASIVSKNSYPVVFNSVPSKAQITIINRKGETIYTGTTPATISLRSGSSYFRREKYSIKYSKDGYDDLIFPLEADVDGWYFGNLIFGGALGLLIIDPATGAMYKISNTMISMSLSEVTASTEGALNIRDINDIPEDWKAHLEKVN